MTERGEIAEVSGVAFAAGTVPQSVADRIVRALNGLAGVPLLPFSICFPPRGLNGSLQGGERFSTVFVSRSMGTASFLSPFRQANAARKRLGSSGAVSRDRIRDIQAVCEPPARVIGSGAGVTLVARTTTGCLLGATALGERGVSSETVGEAAADALVAQLETGACVDEHLADQLVIFMALAEGESRVLAPYPLSLHAQTAMAVAEQVTQGAAKFRVLVAGAAAEQDAAAAAGGGAVEGAAATGAGATGLGAKTCMIVCMGAGIKCGEETTRVRGAFTAAGAKEEEEKEKTEEPQQQQEASASGAASSVVVVAAAEGNKIPPPPTT